MNENAVTRALMGTLARSEPSLTTRFCKEVVGVDLPRAEEGFTYRDQATWEDLGHHQAVVVGIAPLPGLSLSEQRYAPGSIVDAVVVGGGVAVLLEFKITGRCQHAQLVRHAQHWALDIPNTIPTWTDTPPVGFALSTWSRVAGWLGRELLRPGFSERDRNRLVQLADTLKASPLRLTADPREVANPVGASTVAVDCPRPTPSREMTQGVDLDALHRTCSTLYGKGGTHHVAGSACRADVQRMRQAFNDANCTPPTGLRGNAMTPRRVLSALYAGERLSDAAPAAWTDLRTRVIGRGGDRKVLLAMLAWAAHVPNTAASRRIYGTTARIWSQTPAHQPGMPELPPTGC